jgi:hypothetical protein
VTFFRDVFCGDLTCNKRREKIEMGEVKKEKYKKLQKKKTQKSECEKQKNGFERLMENVNWSRQAFFPLEGQLRFVFGRKVERTVFFGRKCDDRVTR